MKELDVEFPESVKVSDQCKNFVKSLLIKEPSIRLGAKFGFLEVKSHPWFEGFKWDEL